MSEEIIVAYQNGSPTRANSREIVRKIASHHNLTEAKVRGILSRAGVYVSLPKNKSEIELTDYDAIFARFTESGDIGSSFSSGSDALMTSLSQEFGYGKWTLTNLYREWRMLGKPLNQRHFDLLKKRQSEDWQQKFNEEVDRLMAPRIRAIEKQHESQMMLLKASQPGTGSGIFNPLVATFILFVLVVAGLIAVLFS